jgi:chaperone BCS1
MLCKIPHAEDHAIHYQPSNTGEILSVSHKGKTVYVKRVAESAGAQTDGGKSIRVEKLLMSVLGSDPSAIKSLIADAIQHKSTQISKNISVFMCSRWFDEWDKVMEGRIRTLESVILDKSEDILKDMHTFLMSKEWYNRMGIPYRRGYLFHGPPGNGKTSLCKAFAGELQLDICVLSLSSPDVTDGKLTQILRVTPVRSLVLLEDVDAVFVQRETSEPIKLSFSGLLNAIDGVVSQEGRIFIMTTNHIEKLDPALIRPGRCDVKLEVRNASRSQLAAMFVRFFPGRDAEAGSFADQIPEYRVSMAEIQNHLLQHKDSPEKALETLNQMNVNLSQITCTNQTAAGTQTPPPPPSSASRAAGSADRTPHHRAP